MNDIGIGLIAVAIAVVFFGSNFIPIKQYKTGDGMFFQWILCVAIWHVGLVVNIIRGQPEFQPVAMCGGLIWATGNLLTVQIVKRIGLAMGLLIWGATNLCAGWLSGVVGLMGIKKQTDDITSWPLNYTGVILGLVAMGIAAFIEPEINENEDYPIAVLVGEDNIPRSGSNIQQTSGTLDDSSIDIPYSLITNGKQPSGEEEPKSPTRERFIGIILSIIAGTCYGINFDPPQYVIDNYDGASQESIDYVFSHFCGILLASTFWFAVYCAYKTYYVKQPVEVYPRVILPGFISGMLWGMAQTSFFVANQKLDFVVSFPLISLGPGFVGFLWGVFVFKEIRGIRNYLFLLGVFITATGCAVCIVFSRL